MSTTECQKFDELKIYALNDNKLWLDYCGFPHLRILVHPFKASLGALHKWRHVILADFGPLVTERHKMSDPLNTMSQSLVPLQKTYFY